MARSTDNRKRTQAETEVTAEADVAAELNYSEAHTALELALTQLQDSTLPVEAMADLYQRARRYAERCDQVLTQVEQQVQLWDPERPDDEPKPYASPVG